MHERIALIRKDQRLNQEEFAGRIGITKSAVSGYEIGRRNPTDQAIRSICREFNVNEEWLRYGYGDMYQPLPNGSIDALVKEFNCTNFEAEFLEAYFSLTEAERMEFVKCLLKVFGPVMNKTVNAGVNPLAQKSTSAAAEVDIEAEVALYREQLLSQKEAEAELSASNGRSSVG